MNNNMKEYQHHVRVYHHYTDAMKIVHHASYLYFFEQGRAELLRSIGIQLPYMLEEHGVQFAVASIDVKYLAPAKLDDYILITSKIVKLDKVSITFQQVAAMPDNKMVFCKAILRVVTLGMDHKLISIPEYLKRRLVDG